MRYGSVAIVVLAGVLASTACDETGGPGPDPNAADGGVVLVDGTAPAPPPNDGAVIDPIPFDAGTVPAPTCKGLFELCSGQECCSPNACVNGTCR
jgi:hypothetical protein